MLHYPYIDPVALNLGPLKVHWYGLMYAIGFIGAWLLGSYRAKKTNSGWTQEEVSDLLFYTALGIILGGRIGYLIFYNFGDFLAHPWIVFAIWQGGMSFHGGLLGVAFAFYLFSRKRHKNFFDITDFVAPLVPLGLGAGRIGNFINGELWGRVSQVSWAMAFPHAGQSPRHPSQLYEFFLEGVVLFLFLWIYSCKKRPRMRVSGWFLVLYGIFRVAVEAFRQPDVQLGFIAWNWLTMGQLLSIPMIVVGLLLLLKSR